MKIRSFTAALLAPIFCYCNKTSTNELLDASFATNGAKSIELISPTNNSTTLTANPTLTWTSRTGLSRFRVQIATEAGFKNIILDKIIDDSSYTISNADLIGLSQLSSDDYYWRVRLPIAGNDLLSATFAMHVVNLVAGFQNTLYVDASSVASVQTGSKSSPFSTIQGAIESANNMRGGLSRSDIIFRVNIAKGTYQEEVILKPGISLYGGYDAQNWSRNTGQYISIIASPTDKGVVATSQVPIAARGTTVVDGFTIATPGTTAANMYFFSLVGGNPTISNCVISDSNTISSTGHTSIYISGASPQILNNAIWMSAAGATTNVTPVSITGASSPLVSGNNIFASSIQSVSGVIISGSTTTLTGNSIVTVNMTGGAVNNYGVQLFSGANAFVSNNIIEIVAHGAGSATTPLNINGSNPVVANNTLVTSYASNAYGIYLTSSASSPVITNNIIVTLSSLTTSTRFGIYESTTGSYDPRSLENNLFWDVGNGGTSYLYYDEGTTNIASIAALEALTDWPGGTDKGRGNILVTAGNAGNPFVNFPKFGDRTTAGTTTSFTVSSGTNYKSCEYVEIHRDGIPRQLSCGACATACAAAITFSPAMSSAVTANQEIRYWGAHAGAAACYVSAPGTSCAAIVPDFHLAQNSLTVGQWNNVRYGGKNTSGANCGAPASGPGAGPGGEGCGNVSVDRDGISRTTGNSGLATNTNNGGIPGGFSIGAYEAD